MGTSGAPPATTSNGKSECDCATVLAWISCPIWCPLGLLCYVGTLGCCCHSCIVD